MTKHYTTSNPNKFVNREFENVAKNAVVGAVFSTVAAAAVGNIISKLGRRKTKIVVVNKEGEVQEVVEDE